MGKSSGTAGTDQRWEPLPGYFLDGECCISLEYRNISLKYRQSISLEYQSSNSIVKLFSHCFWIWISINQSLSGFVQWMQIVEIIPSTCWVGTWFQPILFNFFIKDRYQCPNCIIYEVRTCQKMQQSVSQYCKMPNGQKDITFSYPESDGSHSISWITTVACGADLRGTEIPTAPGNATSFQFKSH